MKINVGVLLLALILAGPVFSGSLLVETNRKGQAGFVRLEGMDLIEIIKPDQPAPRLDALSPERRDFTLGRFAWLDVRGIDLVAGSVQKISNNSITAVIQFDVRYIFKRYYHLPNGTLITQALMTINQGPGSKISVTIERFEDSQIIESVGRHLGFERAFEGQAVVDEATMDFLKTAIAPILEQHFQANQKILTQFQLSSVP